MSARSYLYSLGDREQVLAQAGGVAPTRARSPGCAGVVLAIGRALVAEPRLPLLGEPSMGPAPRIVTTRC